MYAMDFAQVGANIQKQLNIKGLTQQSLADASVAARGEIFKYTTPGFETDYL